MQMLITLSVGEVKTVYVRCDEQQRGATLKAAQTRIEHGNTGTVHLPTLTGDCL